MRGLITVLGLLVGVSQAQAADRLTLVNRDVLTGELRSATAADVVFASDLAGTVTVKRASIAQLTRIAPDGRAELVQSSELDALVERLQERGAAGWNGAANADVAMSRGNSDTATAAIHGTATRLGPGDKLATYATYLLSTAGPGGGRSLARAARGGARYDRDFLKPLFTFAFGDVEHDVLQLLELRTVAGGGSGVHLANSPRVQANVFGGVSYARDSYTSVPTDPIAATTAPTTSTAVSAATVNSNASANSNGNALAAGRNPTITIETRTPPVVVNPTLTRSVGEYVIGQDLVGQLSGTVTLTQRVALFPAMRDPGDYRISFDLSVSGQISSRWQWHSTVADRYLRIPPSGGAVRNDLFIATGLGVTLGQGDVGGYKGSDTRPR